MTLHTSRSSLPHTGLAALLASLDTPGEIQLPDGTVVATGTGDPRYRVIFRTASALRTPMTELDVGRSYISGEIEVEGDISALFDARERLRNQIPLRQKVRFVYDFLRSATQMNAKAINDHYSYGDDFFLTFMDTRYRLYSHGTFASPDDTLENASGRKLEAMFTALDLKPGMRLLDIGGGWGGVTQYCGARGVHVTTLTIAPDSARYIQRLIAEKDLPGEVFLQDFLVHQPTALYNHAVIYGVIEHIPNYARFAHRVWDVLEPGGRLYLDGSAAVEKFTASAFTRKYIWPGAHAFMTVQDVMAELLFHGFEIVEVKRETRDYELTMLEWARRLERASDQIIARWGAETYRVFRLYLWGGTHAFRTNALQAYHLVAERRPSAGPRPSIVRRMVQFLGSLR
jgi:cyclopropane-fatty-acyl-phospholipid synthase